MILLHYKGNNGLNVILYTFFYYILIYNIIL